MPGQYRGNPWQLRGTTCPLFFLLFPSPFFLSPFGCFKVNLLLGRGDISPGSGSALKGKREDPLDGKFNSGFPSAMPSHPDSTPYPCSSCQAMVFKSTSLSESTSICSFDVPALCQASSQSNEQT